MTAVENKMIRFAVGYQRPLTGESFCDIVEDYREKISEVYFPWIGVATGRPVHGISDGMPDWEAQQVLENDLRRLAEDGVKLDLLLNGNCYGERAVSKGFEKEIVTLIEHLYVIGCKPDIVTTTSFFVARTLKKYCSGIEVRASVNMRIGTIQAMSYASDYFDSFYMQRDLQRNIENVKRIRAWCTENNKRFGMLANSGCLRFCPAQVFHDNLLAHSAKVEEQNNVEDWNPHLCHNLYAKPENYVYILQSTWIRPEDLHLYDGLPDFVKLATRQHSHPRMVLDAYSRGYYSGNLLDLLEPGFSYAFNPYYISNSDFPDEWGERMTECKNDCSLCSYCKSVLPDVLKKMSL